VRTATGAELPQALEAVAEAMALHLAVAARLPDRASHQDQLALTQRVRELVVARMGPQPRPARARAGGGPGRDQRY